MSLQAEPATATATGRNPGWEKNPGKETPVDDNVDDDVKAEADAEAVAQVEDGHVIK